MLFMSEAWDREKAVAEGAAFDYGPETWVYDCTINVFRAMLDEAGLNHTIDGAVVTRANFNAQNRNLRDHGGICVRERRHFSGDIKPPFLME